MSADDQLIHKLLTHEKHWGEDYGGVGAYACLSVPCHVHLQGSKLVESQGSTEPSQSLCTASCLHQQLKPQFLIWKPVLR